MKEQTVVAGRYRLEEWLGGGGMGTVFRATQLGLGRAVAVKIMLPHVAAQPQAGERFTREARVAALLRHPGSVEIYDFGDDQGSLFIAMELLRGHTLRVDVDGIADPLPIARALDVGFQVADVLVAAHAISLVHRDLKPENLFLEPAGDGERVVVVDFGLAFVATGGETLGRMTEAGLVAGTLPYLSPEQARGGTVGPEADVYALGCVLYEMLTGRPPFEGEGAIVLTRHMFVPPSPPRRHRPAIPGGLDDLVMRMLAKEARARPTAAAVQAALAAIDPEATEQRARAREARGLTGRAARMVSETPARTAAPSPVPPADAVRLRIVGPPDEELALALAANGFLVDDTAPAAIYAPGSDVTALVRLAAGGVPVISDAEPGDLARVRDLLRAGVAEVVLRPVTAGSLAQKLVRVLRRRREVE